MNNAGVVPAAVGGNCCRHAYSPGLWACEGSVALFVHVGVAEGGIAGNVNVPQLPSRNVILLVSLINSLPLIKIQNIPKD